MQVPAPFEYERATSVDQAIGLLDRLGDSARLVAGGHSLLPMMKLRLANFEYLIDINDLHSELGYIVSDPGWIRIGALTRHRELYESDELAAAFPIFRDAERVIADPIVRNRGTLGGSLCQADPSEDLSAVCTTLNASCVIQGSAGRRVVIQAVKRTGAKAIVMEPFYDRKVADLVAKQTGIKVLLLPPSVGGIRGAPVNDYVSLMKYDMAQLAAAVR